MEFRFGNGNTIIFVCDIFNVERLIKR